MNTIYLNTIGTPCKAGGGGNSGGGGNTGGYAPIPNGVYIQHINRKLYTPEEWTAGGYASSDANGVAVVDDDANFVVSKDKSEVMVWSSYTPVISGVYANSSDASAKKDMNGRQNTRLILELADDGAAVFCANYTFPNGKKGYLPSLGEWNIVSSNMTAILDAMALIDGTPLDKGYQWSSTQGTSSNTAWYVSLSSRYFSKTDKNWAGCTARPFTSL